MQHLCQNTHREVVPIYLEFPRGTRNFADLYREFVIRLPSQVLDESFLELATSPEKPAIESQLETEVPDLMRALQLHYMGTSEQQEIVKRWLTTDIRDLRTLKTVGLRRGLATTEECVKCLSGLLRVISFGSDGTQRRVLWMIDEFQRVEDCRRPAKEEINAALNSTFNRSPTSLTMLLSFSGKPNRGLPDWLSQDLADRIGIEKVLLLPPLTSDDAFLFAQDILNHYRADGFDGDPTFPFSKKAIRSIIDQADTMTDLRPRALIHCFNAVLEEADALIEGGTLDHITAEFALEVLKDRKYLGTQD